MRMWEACSSSPNCERINLARNMNNHKCISKIWRCSSSHLAVLILFCLLLIAYSISAVKRVFLLLASCRYLYCTAQDFSLASGYQG